MYQAHTLNMAKTLLTKWLAVQLIIENFFNAKLKTFNKNNIQDFENLT